RRGGAASLGAASARREQRGGAHISARRRARPRSEAGEGRGVAAGARSGGTRACPRAPPPRPPAGGVRGEPGMWSSAATATGAGRAADRTPAPAAAAAGDEAARSLEALPLQLERTSRGGASQPPGHSASTVAAPSGMAANDAAPAERSRRAVPPVSVAPAVPPPPPAAAAVARPELAAEAKVEAAPPPPPRVGGASPLRSSFGADTGTDFYWRVRRGLLAEGRLPRAASVRADELANAFELAAEMPAVGRPELAVEGAPLPAAGATYLVRFEARGLTGRSSSDSVEVDFDPAVVALFRRVGATAHRGGAAALYEIELRPEVTAAPAAQGVMAGKRPDAASPALGPMAPKPGAEPRPGGTPHPAAASRMKAASPPASGEPRGAAAPGP